MPSLKKLRFDFDFTDLAVRGRAARGNTVTKNTVKRIELKSEGVSTLAAREIWFDETVLKLNDQGRGRSLGRFRGEDKLLEVDAKGNYRIVTPDLLLHFNEVPFYLERWEPQRPLAAVYFDGIKERHMVKRFELEPRGDGWECFVTEHAKSALLILTAADRSTVSIRFRKVNGKEREDEQLILEEFIAVKGWKALGNMLHTGPVLAVRLVSAERNEPAPVEEGTASPTEASEDGIEVGTTVEWSDLAQAPTPIDGASEPEVDFGTEDDGQITLNF